MLLIQGRYKYKGADGPNPCARASNPLQLDRQELERPMSVRGMTRATIYPNRRRRPVVLNDRQIKTCRHPG